jgi:hypothetical protein
MDTCPECETVCPLPPLCQGGGARSCELQSESPSCGWTCFLGSAPGDNSDYVCESPACEFEWIPPTTSTATSVP